MTENENKQKTMPREWRWEGDTRRGKRVGCQHRASKWRVKRTLAHETEAKNSMGDKSLECAIIGKKSMSANQVSASRDAPSRAGKVKTEMETRMNL